MSEEIIKEARKIVAKFWEREPGHFSEKPEIDPILDGDEDRSVEVRIAVAAIMAASFGISTWLRTGDYDSEMRSYADGFAEDVENARWIKKQSHG